MKTVGRHLVAEFYGCDTEKLNTEAVIKQAMFDAAQAVKATIVGSVFHRFDPQGVSGTIVISESHLSIHTWPENGYAAVDIYTCGGLDPWSGIDDLGIQLGAKSRRVQETVRGIFEDIEEDYHLLPDDVRILPMEVWEEELGA